MRGLSFPYPTLSQWELGGGHPNARSERFIGLRPLCTPVAVPALRLIPERAPFGDTEPSSPGRAVVLRPAPLNTSDSLRPFGHQDLARRGAQDHRPTGRPCIPSAPVSGAPRLNGVLFS